MFNTIRPRSNIRKRGPFLLLALIVSLCLPAVLAAQNQAILVYAENPDAVEILDIDGFSRVASIGEEIAGGETIATGRSSAEIKLSPNGTIIKIARNTNFVIEALAGSAGKSDNEFALLGGKLRTVAAKAASGERYRIRTPTAVCGVRGTDFSMNVQPGAQDAVFVKRGLVEFSRNVGGAMESVMVGAGQFADAFGASFMAAAFSAEQFASEFSDLEFSALDPEAVPQAEDLTQAAASEEGSEETTGADTGAAAGEPGTTVTEEVDKPLPPKVDASESKIMAWLREVLGFEIGSVTIDQKTYSKAVIQPNFNFGKLRFGLYLPVIYTSDLFNPDDWYKPAGNNEWSFGTDIGWTDDPLNAAWDAVSDLALKIRFLELNNRYVDPWYFNIGNLSSMTIGHGVLMRNFANDSEFPSVRRVGLNAGFDLGFWGGEVVVDDLAKAEIFGGRLKTLSILGLSGIVDIDPAGDLPANLKAESGDPILIGAGLDLDLPIVKFDFLNVRAFADAAAVVPYIRDVSDASFTSAGIESGIQLQSVFDSTQSGLDMFRNYGVVAGFLGRIIVVDFRLEYRLFRGAYRPTFFDAAYERNRGLYALDFARTLKDPDALYSNKATVNGIYGEAGFSFLKDKLSFSAGYMMPWSFDSDIDWMEVAKGDYLMAELVIKKGLIPVIDVSGSFAYERTGFMHAVLGGEGVTLFDEKTILKGELIYPIADMIDMAIVASTATAHNTDGTIKYDGGKPVIEPTITFETRIHF